MVGCMVATSLAMAPAMLLAQRARGRSRRTAIARARVSWTCATKAAWFTRRRQSCGDNLITLLFPRVPG
jgi:hypothetical protein